MKHTKKNHRQTLCGKFRQDGYSFDCKRVFILLFRHLGSDQGVGAGGEGGQYPRGGGGGQRPSTFVQFTPIL